MSGQERKVMREGHHGRGRDKSCCHEEDGPGKKRLWYRGPLGWTLAGSVAVALATFVPGFEGFRHALLGYARIILLPIALGFFLAGLMDYFVPREYISKHLARRSRRTIFYSVGFGLLASACSHGILALSMELHKKGASGPAVVSFLLASPWANLPVTILLIGFFGWRGFLIIAAALAVALSTGLIFQVLERRGWIESNPHSVAVPDGFSVRADLARRWKRLKWDRAAVWNAFRGVGRGIYELAEMVLWWLFLGVVLASLASAFVPQSWFARWLGPSLGGLLATLVLATLLEVCSEGTSPLAFEMYRQTGALGNAFAFLMGGVVTDFSEIGLLWANLGKRTALWTLGLTLPQVILLGWFFNLF
jgi:uncharacterized membrane protein YraQ (UPF0718 family)